MEKKLGMIIGSGGGDDNDREDNAIVDCCID